MPTKEHILMAIALQQTMARSQDITAYAAPHEVDAMKDHVQALRRIVTELMGFAAKLQTSEQDRAEIQRICEPKRALRPSNPLGH